MRSGSSSERLASAIGTLPPFEVKPQPGPQTLFATTFADIAIYGGAAGGGKSFGLQMEPLRHIMTTPGFEAVLFRRTTPQITNPGALWDTCQRLYAQTGAKSYGGSHEFRWRGGGKLKLAHLVLEQTVHDWQGAQIALVMFDELTQFSAFQFWYMVSRNRSTCGVPPYVRAACNPDADSWVADFIAWWIDQATGFPIPERVGKLRYLVRGPNDSLIWGDSAEEVLAYLPKVEDLPPGTAIPRPKSVTFIPAKIFDNPALLSVNPEYLANLLALPTVERERLLGGNWKIRPAAGLYFKRSWCEMIDIAPPMRDTVRYWDLAGTEKIEGNDPDWTVGVKLGRDEAGGLYVLDVIRERVGALAVEQLLRNTASHDGKTCKLGWGKDPGQAGVSQTQHFIRMLAGYWVVPASETGDKITRFGPASAQCQAGNVKILRGRWNEDFFRTLEGFPELSHDDDVDAFSGAVDLMHLQAPGMNVYELYRRQAAELAAKEAEKRAALKTEIVAAPGSMEHAAMTNPQSE